MTATVHTVERKATSVAINGQTVVAEILSVPMAFARKPANLEEIAGSEHHRVFVTETREMSIAEFDAFASNLLASRDWLAGKGGYHDDGRLCIEIKAPDRPVLYVDPSGSDYARYVARLG